jgi:hypothetical protein
MGRPVYWLPTTKVFAAMSPTRRWPLLVSITMNPTRPAHSPSTMNRTQRMIARPMPGGSPSSATVRIPKSSLPGVQPLSPWITT